MIQKQAFPVPFGQGLDQKTDPKQVSVGKFLSLVNTVFLKGGLLQKRNGFGALTDLSNDFSTYLTTFNGNLTAIGLSVNAFNQNNETWVSRGSFQTMEVSTLPLVRNNFNQTQCDSAIINNMVCTVYTQTTTSTVAVTNQYLYVIADATTGQNIIEPTALPVISGGSISGFSRVFAINNSFVIISQVLVSTSTSLQYFAIPVNNPSLPGTAHLVTSDLYVPLGPNPGWDGVVVPSAQGGPAIVVAYNTTTGAQGVHVATLSSAQIAAKQTSSTIKTFSNAAYVADIMSVCVDATINENTGNPDIVYVSFWNPNTSNGYTLAVFIGFASITTQFAPVQTITDMAVVNLASAAQNGSCTLFSEILNAYSFGASILSNFITGTVINSAGSITTAQYNVIRSVGLASKAFAVGETVYFLSTYQSPFQPSYFVINGTNSTQANPIVAGKIAYENGSNGYYATGLPSVTITDDNIVQIPYFFRDLIESLNTLQNTQQTTAGGIYSQTGIELGTFTVGTTNIDSSEIGSNLHISGGFLWMYDGFLPVEHNFFLWPDSIGVTYTETSTVTPTGTASVGFNQIAVSSSTGIFPGMTIADTTNPTFIPTGTTVLFVDGTTITMSERTTHTIIGDTLSIHGNIVDQPPGFVSGQPAYFYQVVYKWTDNQGNPFMSAPSIPVSISPTGTTSVATATINIPTLRLTYKIENPISIHVYRWSVANQVYYEVTNILAPLLNDTTVDSVSFVDTLPDADIIGNNIIYTNGGVVEDVNAPASSIMTLADSRLWLVDAEDPNLFWFSKQVIEGTPVEMSDLFTFFVSPTVGAQGSTGPITAAAPMDGNLIVFKKNAINYISLSAGGPDNTGANSQYSQPIFITSVVGCSNQQSIVFTPSGLLFQSGQGIWLLDRNLQAEYLGAPVEGFNGSIVESAINIPETTQVRFTLNTGQTIMYDYYFNQWGTFQGAPGISSCVYQNLHTYLDSSGQVFQETPGVFLDGTNPVLMSFLTGWIQLQGISGFQRLWELQLLGSYVSPHLLNVQLGYDFGALSEQAIIEPTNFTGVFGSDQLYGQTSPFGGPGSLEQWRIQPATEQCQAFQISMEEIYDPSFGVPAGAGFTLSAITCVLGLNRGYRPIKATNTVGTS
jgi:hypothetical protein